MLSQQQLLQGQIAILSVLGVSAMELYIEQVLFDNWLVDFALLYCTAAFSLPGASRIRMMISAALGAIYAVLMPLFEILAFWGCKVLLAVLLLITAFYRRGHIRELVRGAVVFAVSTVFAGGASVALACVLGTDLFAGAGGMYASGKHAPIIFSATGALLLSAGFARHGAERYLQQVRRSAVVIIVTEKGSVRLKAIMDTGNSLEKEGVPVAVVSTEAVRPVLNADFLRLIQGETPEAQTQFYIIPYHAVGTECGVLYGFLPLETRIEYNGSARNVRCIVAVCGEGKHFAGRSQALVPVFLQEDTRNQIS